MLSKNNLSKLFFMLKYYMQKYYKPLRYILLQDKNYIYDKFEKKTYPLSNLNIKYDSSFIYYNYLTDEYYLYCNVQEGYPLYFYKNKNPKIVTYIYTIPSLDFIAKFENVNQSYLKNIIINAFDGNFSKTTYDAKFLTPINGKLISLMYKDDYLLRYQASSYLYNIFVQKIAMNKQHTILLDLLSNTKFYKRLKYPYYVNVLFDKYIMIQMHWHAAAILPFINKYTFNFEYSDLIDFKYKIVDNALV
jgi:hypothetical protein